MSTFRELLGRVTPGPYFVAHDSGQKSADLLAHSGSGLAIVDTGRGEDWPIARYCEWPQAELIARCSPETMKLVLEALESSKAFVEGGLEGNPAKRKAQVAQLKAALSALNGPGPKEAGE